MIYGYGRAVPKPSTGRINFEYSTASTVEIRDGACRIYDRTALKQLLIRKLSISSSVVNKKKAKKKEYEQFSLFDSHDEEKKQINSEKEEKVQKTIIEIKKRFGKNAIMNVSDLQSDATLIKRTSDIGGDKA